VRGYIHSPIAMEAGGSEEALRGLKTRTERSGEIEGLDARARAAVEYTDAMTLKVQVPDAVFERVKDYFDVKELVELTNTIAGFNAVVRLVVALDVGEKNQTTSDQ